MYSSEIPLLKAVAQTIEPVPGSALVSQVVERFQRDSALLAVPVASDGSFAGISSRKDLFFQHLAKPFARDLYSKKPISQLLDSRPLVLPADWNIHQGLEALLQHDPALSHDCFAVTDQGRCIGIVAVADLMMTISRMQAGLLETLEQLSRRIRSEVEMARRIQNDLLPVTPLTRNNLLLVGDLVNSTEISGDFFDLFFPTPGQTGLLVADVTGHGVQAGLVTTAAKAGLQTLLDNGVTRPAELLCGINRSILATARQQLMMTALIALFDQERGCLRLASAGHPFPRQYRAASRTWHELPLEPGFPLGFDEQAAYCEAELAFLPGDRLLLFSDGIIEAENSAGEPFGAVRFQQVLQQGCDLEPEALKDRLLAEARSFTGHELFEDDVTLLLAADQGEHQHVEP